MSDELDPELRALEDRLREAHASLAPPPGLRERLRPRPSRLRLGLAWPGVAAAAAVLLAVGGVGYLLSRPPATTGGGAGASVANGRYDLAPFQGGFGRLPRPVALNAGAAAGGLNSAPAPQAVPAAPLAGQLPVYRWTGQMPLLHCPALPTLDGYPVLRGCAPASMASAIYRLESAPAGARIVYVPVADASNTYFEPAYQLPDGSIVTALTPDELRP